MSDLNYQARNDLLANKTILVTGAGEGIGREAALSFAQHGATVILLGRTVSKLEAVYDDIVKAGYPEPSIVPLDLEGATQDHYRQMGQTIIDQFKHLDGILHNASILGQLGPFADIPLDEFNQVMQINLNAAFMMTQALLPAMNKAPKASVVFTTSSVGRTGRSFWGSYAISKFATEGLMQVLADEYAQRSIRFNCINPGATRTQMRAKAFPAENPDTLKTPQQLMPLYLYLMGDDSDGVNGQSIDCQPKH